MKSERDLPLIIASLVRDAAPVVPLAAPPVRLARWAIASMALAPLAVVALGVRPDVGAAMRDGWFIARAAATLGLAAGAALVALVTSVPGLRASLGIRAWPWLAAAAWAGLLGTTIAGAPSPLASLAQATPHPSCVLFIVAIGVMPGAALLRMVRNAAPLQGALTSGLAGLASAALGALGAQFVCATDAAAHHLLWHFAPVALLALASCSFGRSFSRIRPR